MHGLGDELRSLDSLRDRRSPGGMAEGGLTAGTPA
jgi:hypothetical protein